MRLLIPLLSSILVFWSPPAALSQAEAGPAPIRIEADRMETSRQEGEVQFSGSVQANQGDLTINADAMTVLYAGAADAAAGTAADITRRVDRITATGNVKIVQGNWVAAGDTMDFKADDRVVILAGNARAWQDQNMVSGEKIVLYLDEGRSVVEKSSEAGERVKAFIYPSAAEEKDSGEQ